MKLSQVILISIGMILPSTLCAQIDHVGTINGIVVADSTNNPLEFVNVHLLRNNDTSLVTGTSTDNSGKFAFHDVQPGTYLLRFTMVGYEVRTIPTLTIDDQHLHYDVGTISVIQVPVDMEEVTVTAEKSPFTPSIDRMVYNVDQDILNKASSASELLENIPSVQVDLNGEVSLRGSKRVLMMINGRRSPILERQEGTFLEQLPANSIERVEVITTPSARYRAEGKSGIINIVLKKDTPLGIHGNLTNHIGTDGRYNGNVRVNFSPGRFNLYGSYSFRKENHNRNNSDVRFEATRTDPNTVSSVYTSNLFSFYKPLTHMITLGFDYRIDSLNSFGISGNYFRSSFTRSDSSYRVLQNTAGIPINEYVRNDFGDETDNEYGLTFNYHHNFLRQDHKLHFEVSASRSPENDAYHFTNTYLSPTFPASYDNSVTAQRDDRAHVAIDYSNALTKSSAIEAGYTGELSRTDLDYYAENYDLALHQFIPDTTKTSRYSYNQSIQSVYGSVKKSYGKFGLLFGFRVERVTGKSSLLSIDSIISATYWNIFPSFHLAYAFTKFTEVRLSYSRRISRPKAKELNPFAEYRDPKNISYGNPSLMPEYIHSFELSYQTQNNRIYVRPSLFYRFSFNDITSIKKIVNRSTLQTTKENVLSDASAGAELIFSWRIGEFFSTRLSSTGLYEQLDASNVTSELYKSNISWSGTFTAGVDLAKHSKVELRSHWNSFRLTAQGKQFPNAVASIGFRQGLFDGKLSLSATISDLFNTQKRHETLDIPRLQQTVISTRESRVFFIGCTYRLGSAPKKSTDEEFRNDDNDD